MSEAAPRAIALLTANEVGEVFALVGVDCHVVKSPDEALATLAGLLQRCSVILVDEDVYLMVRPKLRSLLEGLRTPPLLVVLPSLPQPRGIRLRELYDMISRAVGVRLRWSG